MNRSQSCRPGIPRPGLYSLRYPEQRRPLLSKTELRDNVSDSRCDVLSSMRSIDRREGKEDLFLFVQSVAKMSEHTIEAEQMTGGPKIQREVNIPLDFGQQLYNWRLSSLK